MAFNQKIFNTRGGDVKIIFPGGEIVNNYIDPETLNLGGTQYNRSTVQIARQQTIETHTITEGVSQAPQVMFQMVQTSTGSHNFIEIEALISKYAGQCALELETVGATSSFKSLEIKNGIITMSINRDRADITIEGQWSNPVK